MTTIPENATPAMRQWHEMKAQHPDKILMFRMGDFYEMFYDDAVRASNLAGIVLTKRGRDKDSPPLAGVPHTSCNDTSRNLSTKASPSPSPTNSRTRPRPRAW